MEEKLEMYRKMLNRVIKGLHPEVVDIKIVPEMEDVIKYKLVDGFKKDDQGKYYKTKIKKGYLKPELKRVYVELQINEKVNEYDVCGKVRELAEQLDHVSTGFINFAYKVTCKFERIR